MNTIKKLVVAMAMAGMIMVAAAPAARADGLFGGIVNSIVPGLGDDA